MLCMSQFYIFSAYYETLWNRFSVLNSPLPNSEQKDLLQSCQGKPAYEQFFISPENAGPEQRSGDW